MSTLTTAGIASLPRVNLLPPEIEQERRFRKVQSGLGAGVAVALLAVGGLTVLASMAVSDAQTDLDESTTRGSQLQAQQAEFADVPLVYGQVEAAQAQLSEAMGKEVRWSYFLNDLSLKTPSRVWLEKVTVTQNLDAAAVTPVQDPGTYLSSGIGSIGFEGKGLTHNAVAAWLDALAKQKGLTQPYFTNSAKELIGEQTAVGFTSQATITEDALSGRFTQQKAGS